MGWFGRDKNGDSPKIQFVSSKNGLLFVAAPAGAGWQTMQASPQPPMLAAIKCMHGSPPDAVALDAVLSQVDPLPTLEQMLERDWKAHYGATLFESIDVLGVEQVEHTKRDSFREAACQIVVAGRLRERELDILLRERFVPLPARGGRTQLLTITAAASRAAHQAHATVIDTWFAHASPGA